MAVFRPDILKREAGERLYGIELEFLVLQWLTDLASGALNTSEEPEKTLALSGFNDSIREATVTIEEAARSYMLSLTSNLRWC